MEETGVRMRRVRSRSCGAVSGDSEAAPPAAAALNARRKVRRARPCCWRQRRASLPAGGGVDLFEAGDGSSFEFQHGDEARPRAKVVELLPAGTCESRSVVSVSNSNRTGSICTAIATCTVSETKHCISATDLSAVYKTLELLNGYLTLQGFTPYEGAFLSDPRVGEILSHIQHGCPLARRPSKHLPRIDSSALPSIEWSGADMPKKSDLVKSLLTRIHAYTHTDIEVLIGREVYCCHLLALQCYSTYFEDVNGAAKVHLPEEHVSGRAFHMIYDWMITTDCDCYQLLKRENVLEVLHASQFLGIRELEEQCWSFINSERFFNEETAFLLYMEAKRAANTQVAELMLPRVRRFFLKLVSTVDFLTLDVEALCSVLDSNYIAVHSEMEVFMSAVLWLTHDWGKRRPRVTQVMHCVRFGWMAPWEIVDIRRNYSSNPEFIRVTQDPEVRRLLEEGLAFATTREACAGDARRLRHLVDALSLVEPRPRHWLEGGGGTAVPAPDDRDAAAGAGAGDECGAEAASCRSSFQRFIETLPKYREPGALDEMRFVADAVDGEDEAPAPAHASSPAPIVRRCPSPVAELPFNPLCSPLPAAPMSDEPCPLP